MKIFFLLIIFYSCCLPDLFSQTGSTSPAQPANTFGWPTGSDTVCTYGISVFQKRYGGNKEDIGYKIIPEPDSGYVIAGATKSFGNGTKDAWLLKINKRGIVLWSKTVGGANDDDFANVARTVDGGYIAIGTTRSFGNAAGDILLAKFDNNGNLSWSKRYNAGTANGELGSVAVQTSDKGYVLGGTHNFAAGTANGFMMKTDSLGVVLWNKVFDLGSSDVLVDLVNDNDTIIATGHYYGVTFHDGFVMKVNSSNGSLYWSNRYDINSRNNGFIEIFKSNDGYLINTFDNASFSVLDYRMIPLKIDRNGNVLFAKNIDVPGQALPHYGSLSPTADGGFVAATSSILAAGDIFNHKINAAGALSWSKKYIRPGTEFIFEIMPAAEGGFISVGLQSSQPSIADSTNLLVIKTDTAGETPGCTVETAAPILSNASIATSSLSWTITSVTLNTNAITPTVTNAPTVTNTSCIACLVPEDTTCAGGISVFQKRYGGNKEEIGYKIIPVPDSGYVIAGVTKSFGNGSNDAWLMKINKRGVVLWSKTVGGANDDEFVNVTRTVDGGYIAVGTTRSFGNAAGDILLAKFDNNGNLIWSKRYNAGTVNGERGGAVVQTSDKGYVIGGTYNFAPGTANGFMFKTDSSGVVVWNKVFDLGSSDTMDDLVNDNDTIIATGLYYGATFHDGYAMKVNSSNGSLYWSKGYDINSRNNGFIEIFKTIGGYLINTFDNTSFSVLDYRTVPLKIDLNGNVLLVKNLDVPGQTLPHYGSLGPTADGGFVAATSGLTDGDIFIHKINAVGNLSWSKKYIRPGTEFIFEIMPATGGGYIGVGLQNSQPSIADSSNLLVIKTDTAGGTPGCNFESATPILNNASYTTTTPNWTITSVTVNTAVVSPTVTNATPVSNTFCIACIKIQKPTGSLRVFEGGTGSHTLRLYPNPTDGGLINLIIDAEFDDIAEVSVIDWTFGNVVFKSPVKIIQKGTNLMQFNLHGKLNRNRFYALKIRFRNHEQSLKIFSIN